MYARGSGMGKTASGLTEPFTWKGVGSVAVKARGRETGRERMRCHGSVEARIPGLLLLAVGV